MSYVHVKSIAHTRNAVEYERYGREGSEKRRTHLENGTDRMLAVTCDAGSVDAFVDRCEAVRAANSRRIEAVSMIQSFSLDEFRPENPEDVQRVNDLGYMLGQRAAPNSQILVITHGDGEGHDGCGSKLHNHIKCLNQNEETGKALHVGLHHKVAAINDELMREQGCMVIERSKGSLSMDQQSVWELQRGEVTNKFDLKLGDEIEASLCEGLPTNEAEFKENLSKRGITIEEKVYKIKASKDGKKPAHDSVGWTYHYFDSEGPKPRTRRRKASGLSHEFTREGAQKVFELNQQIKEQEKDNERNRGAAEAISRSTEQEPVELYADAGQFEELSTGCNEYEPFTDELRGGAALSDELRAEDTTVERGNDANSANLRDAGVEEGSRSEVDFSRDVKPGQQRVERERQQADQAGRAAGEAAKRDNEKPKPKRSKLVSEMVRGLEKQRARERDDYGPSL